MLSGATPSATRRYGKLPWRLVSGTTWRNGLARKSGYWKLIHSRRPPGSPSGTRFKLGPSALPTAANTSGTVSSPMEPTRWTGTGMAFLPDDALGARSG